VPLSLCFTHHTQIFLEPFFQKASSFLATNKIQVIEKQKRNKLYATLYDSQQLKQSFVFVVLKQ
jgi:hypothetical protein